VAQQILDRRGSRSLAEALATAAALQADTTSTESGTGRTGVCTTTWPMIEADGHAPRLCSKVAAMHALWIVVSRAGSCLGMVNFISFIHDWLPIASLG